MHLILKPLDRPKSEYYGVISAWAKNLLLIFEIFLLTSGKFVGEETLYLEQDNNSPPGDT